MKKLVPGYLESLDPVYIHVYLCNSCTATEIGLLIFSVAKFSYHLLKTLRCSSKDNNVQIYEVLEKITLRCI